MTRSRRILGLLVGAIVVGCGGDKPAPAVQAALDTTPPPSTEAPSPGLTAGPPDPAVLAAGEEAFLICQTCHQADGKGTPGVYPPLAGSEMATGAPDRVIAIVLHGLVGPIAVAGKPFDNVMAPWGALDDDQIAAIITYIRNSWGNQASAVSPADVAAVRRATAERTTQWTIAELDQAKLR